MARKLTATKLQDLSIQYPVVSVSDLTVRTEKNQHGRVTGQYLAHEGEEFELTQRFWNSFSSRFQLSPNVFNYFTTEEVFDRVTSVQGKKADIRLALLTNDGQNSALAVSSPDGALMSLEGTEALLSSSKAEDIGFLNGVVTSKHTPRSGNLLGDIGGEGFEKRFVMGIPVDGYGKPQIALQVLRQICTNGAVAMAPSFQTEIAVGKKPWTVLERALTSFDSEDGYLLIQQRLLAAQMSPASLFECQQLMKIIATIVDTNTKGDVFRSFDKMTGSISAKYGIASFDSLSEKKQRILASDCRIYELFNFATELATHHTDNLAARFKLHAYTGDLMSKEYDLESTAKGAKKFDQFLIKAA